MYEECCQRIGQGSPSRSGHARPSQIEVSVRRCTGLLGEGPSRFHRVVLRERKSLGTSSSGFQTQLFGGVVEGRCDSY